MINAECRQLLEQGLQEIGEGERIADGAQKEMIRETKLTRATDSDDVDMKDGEGLMCQGCELKHDFREVECDEVERIVKMYKEDDEINF